MSYALFSEIRTLVLLMPKAMLEQKKEIYLHDFLNQVEFIKLALSKRRTFNQIDAIQILFPVNNLAIQMGNLLNWASLKKLITS